jgi:hypothetical protein
MPDTERTWADLQTALADNTTKDISPQDLRDAIVSCLGGYASMYVSAGAVAQALTAVPALVTCWTGIGAQRGASADPATDTITVGVAGDYMLTVTATLKAAPPADVDLYIYKNGLAMAGAKSRVQAAAAERTVSLALAVTAIAASDTIQLYATAAPNSSVTFYDAHLTVKRIG